MKSRESYTELTTRSLTTYDIDEGLKAQNIPAINNKEDFGDAVTWHLTWDHECRSMFISLFSDKRHAENWMLQRKSQYRSKNCTILEIYTAELGNSKVFRAEKIVDILSLPIPKKASASVAKEYLVAHRIPPVAIVRTQSVEEYEKGKCLSAFSYAACNSKSNDCKRAKATMILTLI